MLSKALIEDVLNEALSTGGDFAEVFVEDKLNTGLLMIGGKIESTMSGRDFGVGIRIFKGTNSVYAYTNKATRDNLLDVARKAAAAINGERKDIVINLMKNDIVNNHKIVIPVGNVEKLKKVDLMRRAYNVAKNYDDVISQVTVRYGDSEQNVLIANTEGVFVEDKRVRTRTMIQTIASKDGEMQSGFYGPGAHMGFEFYDKINIEEYAKEAARIAKTMIDAEYCPSGKMPVIIDNGFGGVIFHEACGHGLEATSVAKGTSVFAGKIGEKVASELVTAIDDGTIPNEWGSQNIDDEGTPTRKNVLIENGILKGYMIDKLNGRRMGMDSTGSARRQSYKYAPTSRMTNTYIANGESTKEEIIANTEYGLYAKYMGGGSVNPATGEFNFSVMEGYIVRNGKIEKPVRGATLIGKGLEVLKKIDMVGNNLDLGQGMCGSVSGTVAANVGQPTIRVSSMTVGGRKGE
ncbi:TldD/PmbA family protein [Caldisalinibacter kiritimatiensis]|uniref:TldD protein, part of proposed TldE/TldD proteolytic complex n=1 Tax=Caldisalinibacter kiritimatiensis TaxID=1304284 RepID=R1CSD7_9FIRM|nr:TldD/PmbA family protein [Caldisalinibacter kiritimatiensis]EOD01566.1 TldD protein, part of proposed TldE/TldD proteolytic complex [Caldisalinibacter kiritimatiensis]